MSYVASVSRDEEYAFETLEKAESFLLNIVLTDMLAIKNFEPGFSFLSGKKIRYVRPPPKSIELTYDADDWDDPNNGNGNGSSAACLYAVTPRFDFMKALNRAPQDFRDRYSKAYKHLADLLPAQHEEAEKNKKWHEEYLKTYDYSDPLYPPYFSGPGPSTHKYDIGAIGPSPDSLKV